MIALPDLAGRSALVTGASSGVGLEIARALAAAGAAVMLPVRDRGRGERAMAAIRETAPDAALSLRDLDLARLDSVHALASALVAEGTPIDLYVLNAGIVLLGDPERHVTEDGFELHFQSNFLGHAVLTRGILPLLDDSRIAVQCSLAAQTGKVDWGDLQLERRYSPLRAYAASKVLLGLFGMELAARGFAANLCHPGIAPDTGIAAPLRQRASGGLRHVLAGRLGNSPASAAQPALLALTTDAAPPAFAGPSGLFHLGGPAAPQRLYRSLTDPALQRRAWELAERPAYSA